MVDESQRFRCLMRALIIRVVLSSERPYGYSFFCICKNIQPEGKRKHGKLVRWTEELPCFAHECKEQGSMIFLFFYLSPQAHFSSTTLPACCSMRQCNVIPIHIININMQEKRNKVKQLMRLRRHFL